MQQADPSEGPLSLPESSVQHLERLQEKGIRKMRVVSQSQFQEAARKAVARALLETLKDVEISAEARQRLLKRAHTCLGEDLKGATASVEPLSKQVEAESTPRIQVPGPKPPQVDVAPTAGAQKSALGQREKALLVQLSKLIARDWRSELATVRDSQRNQVERLEMRIEELTLALQATDNAITSSGDPRIDALAVQSPFDTKKSELLDQLFQANVALRALSADSQEEEGR